MINIIFEFSVAECPSPDEQRRKNLTSHGWERLYFNKEKVKNTLFLTDNFPGPAAHREAVKKEYSAKQLPGTLSPKMIK
ncbi:MAG: hypothetical protein MUO63_07415 [Desulfobulbaceae bacterium]|nr:hypothetical protein [Desulfobulbaceae bacterium]